jgi:PEP-CTERM motif
MLIRHSPERMAAVKRLLGLAVVAMALQVMPTSAQPVSLIDQNSSATIDPDSQAGMFNWFVDGQDQLAQQWFWYRIGPAGSESSIDTLSTPAVSTFDGTRGLSLLYAGSVFSVQVDYLLTGGATGSGQSDIGESIRITNSTDTALDLHFFQYTDFDLLGNPNGDSTQLSFGPNQYFPADQTKGNALSETVVTPAANHGEAGLFPITLNELNDGSPTTLNDVASAGPEDATWALQWDVTIAPNSTFLLSEDNRLAIPEPSTLALILVGLSVCLFGIRRQSLRS